MSNKLKCPFCQTELEDAGIHSAGFYFWCTNCYMKQKEKNDNYTASPRIWQALIQAKQDLEIALTAIKEIAEECGCLMAALKSTGFESVVETFDKNIRKKLKQIEHKE